MVHYNLWVLSAILYDVLFGHRVFLLGYNDKVRLWV